MRVLLQCIHKLSVRGSAAFRPLQRGRANGFGSIQPKPGNERHRSAVNGALRYRQRRDAPVLLQDRFCRLQPQRTPLQLNANALGLLNCAITSRCCTMTKRTTMNTRKADRLIMGVAVVAAWILVPSALAQRGRGPQGPQVVSPEVSADR